MSASRSNSSFQMLDWVVRAGADISAKDHSGRTALLHYFLTSTSLRTDWEAALDVLGGLLVDIEAADDTHDGFRVLHWIAWYGLSNACGRILQLGADIDIEDHKGNTPLRIAVKYKQKEVALLLLDMEADVSQIYPTDLHPEMRPLVGWASSNDRLHVGRLAAHKEKKLLRGRGEGTLRKVPKVIRVDSP